MRGLILAGVGSALPLVLASPGCKKKGSSEPPQSGFQQGQTGGTYTPTPGPSAQPQTDAGAPICQPGQPCASQPTPGQVPPLGSVGTDPNSLQNILSGAL